VTNESILLSDLILGKAYESLVTAF